MSGHRLIIGADLAGDRPEICYYDMKTKQSAALPLKIGNYKVTLTELFEKTDDPAETSGTIADLFREVFRTFGVADIEREITGMMVTLPSIDATMVRVLRAVFENLGIARSKAYMQEYAESFYNYITYQKKELWSRGSVLFAFRGDQVCCYEVRPASLRNPGSFLSGSDAPVTLPADEAKRDLAFSEYVRDCLKDQPISSAFLTGEGFDPSRSEQSRKVLIDQARRVFSEESVFAKGACNAARERVGERRLTGMTCRSDAIVTCNIGMDLLVGGKSAYYPLITAGRHWYNTTCDCEVLLGSAPELTFRVSGTETGGQYTTGVTLSGLPKRPERTTRLSIHMEFVSRDRCTAVITDLGFGELFPATGQTWEKVLEDVR